jgi:hypothetical protein
MMSSADGEHYDPFKRLNEKYTELSQNALALGICSIILVSDLLPYIH